MVNKLKVEDNIITKPLYAQVFDEDTKEFIEYYYSEMGNRNTIYTIEDKAMLHLNPYNMSIYGSEMNVNYIVAVATIPEYRRKGLMKELMIKALQDMYDQGQAFTYLMPAAEAIYEPYDFVVVGAQEYLGEDSARIEYCNGQITVRDATDKDCEFMAIWANEILRNKNDIYTLRNREYYSRLLKEQKAQNGGVKIYFKGLEMIAIAAFANEEGLKFRDLLKKADTCIPLKYTDNHNMMARIIDIKKFLSCIPIEVIRKNKLINFNLIDEINTEQSGNYRLTRGNIHYFSRETNDELTYTVAELTNLLFKSASVVLNEIV